MDIDHQDRDGDGENGIGKEGQPLKAMFGSMRGMPHQLSFRQRYPLATRRIRLSRNTQSLPPSWIADQPNDAGR